MISVDELVARAKQDGASDIHLICGLPPKYRLDGELRDMEPTPLTAQDCEDVVQTSCAYLIDHFEKFSSYKTQQVAAYLVLLIRSRSIDLRNRQKRIVFEDVGNYAEVSDTECEDDLSLLLEIAFERLSERYKEALTLYYYNGLSIKEMATFLQLSESAAKKLLQRSRDALRNVLKAEGGIFE